MKPWGYTDNPTKSPERAAPLQSPGWNEGKARYETLGKQKSVQRALQGRHSRIAQGEMRAKPDMKPWGHTANTTTSPARATLLQSPGWNKGKARYGTLGKRKYFRECAYLKLETYTHSLEEIYTQKHITTSKLDK